MGSPRTSTLQPDLAPSDFHLFGPLKHHLSGERFPDDDAVERAVGAWFRKQPKEFYAAGFQRLVTGWDMCYICMEIMLKNKCLCHYLHSIIYNHDLQLTY